MEIFHERLSDIGISRELRNFLRDVKKEKTYDQFIRELIKKNTKNPPTNSQHKQNPSTKKGDVI